MNTLVERIGDAAVVMVSGVSGSGKTTLAMALGAYGYEHLSIDRIMWRQHGMCGRDYPEEMFPVYLAEAETDLLSRLGDILSCGGKAVIDFTFCKRDKRDAYRKYVKSRGSDSVLIYCDTPLTEIKQRLHIRNLTPGPDAAIVTDAMAERFFDGFQRPGDDEPHIRYSVGQVF